ncbi:MAG TPA: ribulose-phosphate 3-epimerase [Acidimicrobiia bacterium]|nr:ribulose-phosphate 3-epimerase [Acidimicrobiia bacterium]
MHGVRIAPSLLAADFSCLAEALKSIETEADSLHLDVMDGHFVPNLTFGPPVIKSLRTHTSLPFDCHLMTTAPDLYLADFAAAGADGVTMHIEAVPDPTMPAKAASEQGLRFGLAISPPTPFSALEPYVELCNLVLIMSVQPGFGGQEFDERVLPKVEAARNWIESHDLDADIQIDGGISISTARVAREAGANVFVAGTAVFGASDPAQAIRQLRQVIEGDL